MENISGDVKFRVENRCKYDIGVTLTSNQKPNIRANSFLPLSVDDILYIESIARGRKPFSSGELVAVKDGRDWTLEELGGYTDTYVEKHFNDEEIHNNLSKSAKAISAWLETINDPIELHAIKEVADAMDLPQSKVKILKTKMPNADFLTDEE